MSMRLVLGFAVPLALALAGSVAVTAKVQTYAETDADARDLAQQIRIAAAGGPPVRAVTTNGPVTVRSK